VDPSMVDRCRRLRVLHRTHVHLLRSDFVHPSKVRGRRRNGEAASGMACAGKCKCRFGVAETAWRGSD
jgi:hypothetical protein